MTVALAWPPPSHMVWKPYAAAGRFEVTEQAGHQRDARRAERMTERDRAAARVEALHRVVELLLPHQRDRGEGFVALDRVELVDLHAGALHQLVRHRHRRGEHEHRIFGGDREVTEARPHREVVLLGEVRRSR